MKWQNLPGPARFIDAAIQYLRDGFSLVVASPLLTPAGMEDAFVNALQRDRWDLRRVTVEAHDDPLQGLTEKLYLEPEQWVGWSIERLFERLGPGQVIVIDGVLDSNWEKWRALMRDYEVASRRCPSDTRAVLLVFARGVPKKRLQAKGAALELMEWRGIFGELEVLTYVDQQLRIRRQPARHHKLIVRQIAALALWDLDLADFLVEQSEQLIFDVPTVLEAGRQAIVRGDVPRSAAWEHGGCDHFDGIELQHPFILIEQGDPGDELSRRSWAAQASELLPQIELRRRALAKALARHIPCPFWINQKDPSKRQAPVQTLVRSLDELEIGSLAHVVRLNGPQGELRERANWLAECRNELAHFGLLSAKDALDPRLHG